MLLTIKQVTNLTTLSKSTIYRLIQAGSFPRPAVISSRRVGWKQTDIDTYFQQLKFTKQNKGLHIFGVSTLSICEYGYGISPIDAPDTMSLGAEARLYRWLECLLYGYDLRAAHFRCRDTAVVHDGQLSGIQFKDTYDTNNNPNQILTSEVS